MVTIQGNRVEFSFYRPQARQVFLVGDFNGWRHGELLMTHTGEGYWNASMNLPTGVFKFRYCADGQWFTDYAAFGIEPGPFGWDSVIHIAPRILNVGRTRKRISMQRVAV